MFGIYWLFCQDNPLLNSLYPLFIEAIPLNDPSALNHLLTQIRIIILGRFHKRVFDLYPDFQSLILTFIFNTCMAS